MGVVFLVKIIGGVLFLVEYWGFFGQREYWGCVFLSGGGIFWGRGTGMGRVGIEPKRIFGPIIREKALSAIQGLFYLYIYIFLLTHIRCGTISFARYTSVWN